MELPLQKKEFSPLYTDILPYLLYIMSNKEMAAEKIRTIYTRNKSRDLYDLYYLLKQQKNIDINLINKKLDNYNLTFEKQAFLQKCNALEKNWENELTSLIKEHIPFQTVFSSIQQTIQQQNLE